MMERSQDSNVEAPIVESRRVLRYDAAYGLKCSRTLLFSFQHERVAFSHLVLVIPCALSENKILEERLKSACCEGRILGG